MGFVVSVKRKRGVRSIRGSAGRLGVGAEGEARRKLYEKAAGTRPLSQWVREALDKAAERCRKAAGK